MRSHYALYDSEGNIILPQEEPRTSQEHARSETSAPENTGAMNAPSSLRAVTDIHRHCSTTIRSALSEGAMQYASSARETVHFGRTLMRYGKECLSSCREFLLQPVWVPVWRNRIKTYSRGTLFLIDSVRFGTTFACIFGFLFLAMNYQSFTEILESHFEPVAFGQERAGEDITDTLKKKLRRVPGLSVAGVSEGARIGDLLSFLPSVGPPENRIIIPKLNLNIPLVTPSFGALLREDWTQVEKDIQIALEDGVVHYPGTARPGQAGNFFVTGHSSYYPWAPGHFKTVFSRLHQLKEGDEYVVYYGGDKHVYRVFEKKEVRPSDISVLDQPTGKRTATLMTCTPVGTTLRRLIITAEEVHPENGEVLAVGQRTDAPLQEVKRTSLEALPI